MPTRLKRPSLFRQLAITAALVAFQGYLGYHALNGHFGIESKADMVDQIEVLEAREATLSARIEAYRSRIALFEPQRLDPDILTERARATLGLVRPDDLLIVPDDAG